MISGIRHSLAALAIAAVSLSLLAMPACSVSPLKFAPDALPGASLYQTYQATITISGNKTPVGSISVSAGALPDGIKLTYEQGKNFATLSGDPTLLGTFSFTVRTWCEGTNRPGQSGEHAYTIAVERD
jgi:hypothetical protein